MTFRLNNGFGTTTTPTGGNITDWSAIRDRPDVYPPEDHSHPQSEIVGLAEALAGKQPLTEFKTVGGQEIIGGGNIEFPPGFEETAEELRLQIEGLAERVEDLEARLIVTSPLAFAGGQWAADTGPGPALINIDIIDLPANGGSPITGIEYTFASGSSAAGIPLSGTAPGIRTVETAASSTLYSVRIRALNDAGAGPWSTVKTATSGAPASVAPAAVTPPTLAGNTTVGSIVARTSGTATGNPVPTLSIVWLVNGVVQEGQTANSFDTTGLNAGDIITTRDVWSNGVGEPATATSDPWVLTVQPAITAEPFTLTAGQQATIRFNTAVDTVTVAQGSTTLTATRVGTTNDWTFTPITAEPVAIGATKAGWKEYSATITPAGALPTIIKTDDHRLQFLNVNENTPDEPLTMTGRYAGTRMVSFAPMASGPVFHVAPSQSGTAVVGEELTLDQGVVLNFASAGTASVSYTLLADGIERLVNGPTYTVQSGDAGKSLVWEVEAQDANGSRSVTTNAIAIPGASGLADGVTRIGHVASVETSSSSTHNMSVDLGPADPAKVMYFLIAMQASAVSSLKVIAGGVEYSGVEIQQQTLSTHRLSLWSCAVPAGGAATLQAGTGPVPQTPEVEVFAAKGMTLLSSYKDAVTMTAGTPQNRGMGTTQVNDDLLYAIMAAPINAAGVFSGTTGVAEVWDAPVRGVAPQFWVGFGRETVAGTRTLATTPNASGNAVRISAVFRRV